MIGTGRGPAVRISAAFMAAVAVVALVFVAWVDHARADEADVLYDPETVSAIDIQLSPEAVAALKAEPEEFVKGTFSFAQSDDGTPQGLGPFTTPQEVEVRLKGSASFRDFDEKAAFKLKFPKSGPFLGLRKMTLNNMVEDPSMTHETLTYTVYRALGIPASRTGYAYLMINGEHFGLYLDIENYDDIAMAKKLGSFDNDVQHVYEGEDGADLKPELVGDFEIDEGPDDVTDLEALAAAVVSAEPEPFSTRVAPFADLSEMTLMWGIEKYTGQFDGYAGGDSAIPSDHPNNYFLVSDPEGSFQMLPWGQDETWKEDNHLDFEGSAALMFDGCLPDPACKALYLDSLETIQAETPPLKLDELAVCTAELLAPWQQLEATESTRFEWDAGAIADGVAETREFVATRPAELADFLGTETPVQPDPVSQCPVEEPQPEPKPEQKAPAAIITSPPPPPRGTAKFGSSKVDGAFVVTQVHITGPGTAVQRVSARLDDRRVIVCTDRHTRGTPGRLTVRCKLSKGALDALESGPLKLKIRVGFDPEVGTSRAVIRRLTVPARS